MEKKLGTFSRYSSCFVHYVEMGHSSRERVFVSNRFKVTIEAILLREQWFLHVGLTLCYEGRETTASDRLLFYRACTAVQMTPSSKPFYYITSSWFTENIGTLRNPMTRWQGESSLCLALFCTSLCRYCTTMTWKCKDEILFFFLNFDRVPRNSTCLTQPARLSNTAKRWRLHVL